MQIILCLEPCAKEPISCSHLMLARQHRLVRWCIQCLLERFPCSVSRVAKLFVVIVSLEDLSLLRETQGFSWLGCVFRGALDVILEALSLVLQ